MSIPTIRWENGVLSIIDQTLLPMTMKHITLETVENVWEAIRSLRVRGAPAIGVAAALGVIVGAGQLNTDNLDEFITGVKKTIEYIATSRPTAVNLFWALARMRGVMQLYAGNSVSDLRQLLLDEALRIMNEDKTTCRNIGKHGAALVPDGATILTHCNAGALATVDYGTALGVIYAAHETGKNIAVYADETRPLLQGSRLTAWELMHAGVPVTLICDNMAAKVMYEKKIDLVIVGADRIAANGDTANKIGTYMVALAAQAHNIPFYVAAPSSTFDLTLPCGDQIPIEERAPQEVTHGMGKQTAPEGIAVYSPAFDVTPASLISAFITEQGVIYPPFEQTLKTLNG